MKENLCLFAGFDKFGKIDNYVIDAIKKYSKFCDVYYLADCELSEELLTKTGGVSRLKKYTKYASGYRHKKYDFGSWSELFKIIGWENVEKYKRVILVNDSCYGPFYDIEKICTTDFDKNKCDFFGYTKNSNQSKHRKHIQSFFILLKKQIFTNKNFQKFFDNITELKTKNDICIQYERGLSQLLIKEGFKFDTFIKNSTAYYPKKLMKQNGFLLKVCFFTKCQVDESLLYFKNNFQKQYPYYDINLILNHLKRTNAPALDTTIKQSILITRNYKSIDDIKFILGKNKNFYPIVYLILNTQRFVFLLFNKTIFKMYRSLNKKFKRLFDF